ncbi:MAG TPA: CDP-diacylglycerol--serine O-phosphatidyltransferase [Methylomusa anaerophila]|uniref:CDP-diacylglycerol--serine O-phosphatidyltransferase n=1 Tax=Methylomusa anaerophila TaxID=1930071 RepID=A0A348APR2_9FIRM|nr:CDP-diacylglycerol--serine O-phosphatidyltransferase [Methylomusa anaerophila]BBB93060.1 phosphatidylglycerophosphate synthetase [Methylomusa anaerophila]HML87107.1 CDP-diacylglycerol--serine O-phosphatidyltransferase [Methylomusa anaerophila]
MRNIIPNMLTAFNLILGVFAIIASFHNNFFYAALLIVAAMVADGLDGRVARHFQASSDFGKELDSLCDLVSFGVAPAVLAYVFMLKDFGLAGWIIVALFATCGALRLARFNVDATKIKGYFMGLPIPAAGCVVATFVMLDIKPSGWLFPVMITLFGYLMISTVKYPDFKGKGEKLRFVPATITLVVAGYILYLIPQSILFVSFFAYALFGILNTLFSLFD